MDGHTEGQTNGGANRQTDRWTDGQTDRLTLESEGEIDRYQIKILNKLKETIITHTIPSSAGGCCGNIKQVNTCD